WFNHSLFDPVGIASIDCMEVIFSYILSFTICSCTYNQPEMKSDSFGKFVSEIYGHSKDSLFDIHAIREE
ncbi:MAG: hypothetical protein KDC53_13865, partial [Saprospiraceae bacterium]|nr:hypothetical protein [Saprospiraceae bacterium]